MPTGFPVEHSCLAANPWVTFSSQSVQCLRPSLVPCQLWWESDYTNMAERWREVKRKVETLAVEGTPSVQLEELRFSWRSSVLFFLSGWHGQDGQDGQDLWRTLKLNFMVRAQCLHSSGPVGRQSPERTYLQLFSQQRYPHPLLLAIKRFFWIKSTLVFYQSKQEGDTEVLLIIVSEQKPWTNSQIYKWKKSNFLPIGIFFSYCYLCCRLRRENVTEEKQKTCNLVTRVPSL